MASFNTIRNKANDLIVARSVCPQQGDCERCTQRAVEFAEHVPALLAKLDGPCGSCHPCTNYRDETWRAANRKPPHVIEWDDAQAELKALREVVAAAKAWRWSGETADGHRRAEAALMAAVDALPNPADHLDICPGYGCPGCREGGA